MAATTKRCDSCDEQDAKFRLLLSNMDGEVLDSTAVCADCLKSAAVTNLLTPGSEGPAEEAERDEAYERAADRARGNGFEDTDGKDWT